MSKMNIMHTMNFRSFRKNMAALSLSALTLTGILSGCQLAQTEGQDNSQGSAMSDTLIGAFITVEKDDDYTDKENLRKLANEGGGKYYVQVEKNNNPRPGDCECSIPGVEGFWFMAYCSDAEGSPRWYSYGDDEIVITNLHINATDNDNEVTVNADLYYASDPQASEVESIVFDINLLYMDKNGGIYVVPDDCGSGFQLNSGAGSTFTSTIKESSTKTNSDGSKESQTTEFRINIKSENPISATRVLQMSEAHEILSEETISPDAIPEFIKSASGMAYIILETDTLDNEGHAITNRSIWTPDPYSEYQSFDLMGAGRKGCLCKVSVEVK